MVCFGRLRMRWPETGGIAMEADQAAVSEFPDGLVSSLLPWTIAGRLCAAPA